jgi:Lrp/AsnC family transcriptional regulator for asnA, asnC and gidA
MEEPQRIHLDELDFAILRHLQQDGRRSYSDIAQDLGVAVSTVSARVTKLIEADVVTIVAHVNPHKVGLEAPAILNISIQPRYYDQVIETVLSYPEVTFASMTTGEYNLIVDVFCRNSAHLAELITRRLNTLAGVQDLRVTYHLQILKLRPRGVDLIMSGGDVKPDANRRD